MIPCDANLSGIPIAVLRFVLINPTDQPIDATICGNLENFIGWNGDSGKTPGNTNEFRNRAGEMLAACLCNHRSIPTIPPGARSRLTTTAKDVSYRTAMGRIELGRYAFGLVG